MTIVTDLAGLAWNESDLAELEALANTRTADDRRSTNPTSNAAVNFLHRFHPSAPWVIVTFGPGEGVVGPAKTFQAGEVSEAREFIDAQSGRHNVYFLVNVVGRGFNKKPSKRDIVELHWLHVDVDLRKQLDWSDESAVAAERDRVLAKLRGYTPAPTVINWSGGGFQAFWRLSEIVTVNGDPTAMAPIESRITRIQRALGADPCHNADRVMRLPGTPNVLGPTKMRAGRRPAMAEVVEFHEDRIYDIEEFPPFTGRGSSSGRQTSSERQVGQGFKREEDRARDALTMIPADDYGVYLRIGMALKAGFGDGGFALYRSWAMKSIKFNDDNLRSKWNSIKPLGGVTLATLFGIARNHGWQDDTAGGRIGGSEDFRFESSDAPGAEPDMSILLRNQIPAVPFPVEVFGLAAEWVKQSAASKSAPIDFVALALLVSVAGMIGCHLGRAGQSPASFGEPLLAPLA